MTPQLILVAYVRPEGGISTSHSFRAEQLMVTGSADLRHWQFRDLWDRGFRYWDIIDHGKRMSLAVWPANEQIWLALVDSVTGTARMSGIPEGDFGMALDQPVVMRGNNNHPFIESAEMMIIAAGPREIRAEEVRSSAHFWLLPTIDYRILVTAQV